jgi:hypothetical protein
LKPKLLVLFFLTFLGQSVHAATCSSFDPTKSTAWHNGANNLKWRTDFPTNHASLTHRWQRVDFRKDWLGYINAVKEEIRETAHVEIDGTHIQMPDKAPWWITPWMDYGGSGRESINGLTSERGPDPGDLAHSSPGGFQTWAVGWYNKEGAYALGQVFKNPCDPIVKPKSQTKIWTFPNGTVSFKLLFTTADDSVAYLDGSPVVQGNIGKPGQPRAQGKLRLLQMDIAVRDPRAKETGWVFGTFTWVGPRKGDGLFDNLVPVGLMWGNDPKTLNPDFTAISELKQSKLNPELAGVVWQGSAGTWPERPYPGFQGRLNGPADNMRSSCTACHAAAQFPRQTLFANPPRSADWKMSDPPPQAVVKKVFGTYFKNIKGGNLLDSSSPGIALDYSRQLQAAFERMCSACAAGAMTGRTPQVCKQPNVVPRIETQNCPAANTSHSSNLLKLSAPLTDAPARQ